MERVGDIVDDTLGDQVRVGDSEGLAEAVAVVCVPVILADAEGEGVEVCVPDIVPRTVTVGVANGEMVMVDVEEEVDVLVPVGVLDQVPDLVGESVAVRVLLKVRVMVVDGVWVAVRVGVDGVREPVVLRDTDGVRVRVTEFVDVVLGVRDADKLNVTVNEPVLTVTELVPVPVGEVVLVIEGVKDPVVVNVIVKVFVPVILGVTVALADAVAVKLGVVVCVAVEDGDGVDTVLEGEAVAVRVTLKVLVRVKLVDKVGVLVRVAELLGVYVDVDEGVVVSVCVLVHDIVLSVKVCVLVGDDGETVGVPVNVLDSEGETVGVSDPVIVQVGVAVAVLVREYVWEYVMDGVAV